MRTALVTGATGFIGRHLVEGLQARGVAVKALVRSPEKAGHLAGDGVELVRGSLADLDGWRSSLPGCDAVFHCAGLVSARSRDEYMAVNSAAAGNLADACAAIETPPVLVHLSSLAAAGPVSRYASPRDETSPPRPVSAYGHSKLAGEEQIAKRAVRLPTTVIRPGIVFGPHERNFAAMFQSIHWTHLHVMMGFSSPRLSLIHVTDLVSLILEAAERGDRLPAARSAGDGTGFYHACDDREFPTHARLGRHIARALGTSALILPVPLVFAFPGTFIIEAYWNARGQPSIVSPDKVREATATSWAASATRARKDLGFTPAASLDDRLAETAQWLKEQGVL